MAMVWEPGAAFREQGVVQAGWQAVQGCGGAAGAAREQHLLKGGSGARGDGGQGSGLGGAPLQAGLTGAQGSEKFQPGRGGLGRVWEGGGVGRRGARGGAVMVCRMTARPPAGRCQ